MTWCLGFGFPQFSVLMGDVGTYRQTSTGAWEPLPVGVLKLSLLGPNLAVGFAGSVLIGRSLLEALEHQAAPYPNTIWHPDKAFQWTKTYVEQNYEQYPENARDLGCQLLFVAQEPYPRKWGLPDFGAVAKIRCPTPGSTEVRYERRSAFDIVHIGDAGASEKYREALPKLRTDNSLFNLVYVYTAAPNQTWAGQILCSQVSSAVSADPTDTISDYFFVATVGLLGGALASNNGMFSRPPSSLPVATTYAEYRHLMDQHHGSSGAVLAAQAVA